MTTNLLPEKYVAGVLSSLFSDHFHLTVDLYVESILCQFKRIRNKNTVTFTDSIRDFTALEHKLELW